MEFLDLKQGSMSVMDYVNKFNHLSQYVGPTSILMRRREIVSIVAFLAVCRKSYT